MGILDRFVTIMKSNINAVLDKCEDPAKMIDQTLLDLREDLAEVKKETAGVMADAKRAQRAVDDCETQIAGYTNAAKNALKAGQEADARTLLARKQQYEENLVSLQKTRDLSNENAKKMQDMHEKLVNDIAALEAKRDMIKATVATAKAQQHINDMVSGGDRAKSSLDAFERMEEKVNKMLDAAQAEASLNEDNSEDALMEKYTGGTNSTAVDKKIAKMKAELRL